MFNYLTKEEFINAAKKHNKITVFREISGDTLTPILAYYRLAHLHQEIILLESSSREGLHSRYSHLGIAPIASFSATGNSITLKEQQQTKQVTAEPLTALQQFQHAYRGFAVHEHCGFAGGIAGFFGYDCIRFIEDIPDRHQQVEPLPDLYFSAYQYSLTFDHQNHTITVNNVVTVNASPEQAYIQAMTAIDDLIAQLFATETTSKSFNRKILDYKPNISTECSDQEFCTKVAQAKEYIASGDIFQVVLSRKFTTDYTVDPFSIYRGLRLTSPAPCMFFHKIGDYAIAGASPEILINKKDLRIHSCPLAGTRRKTQDVEQDNLIAQELLNDDKERAEHMMLVDLARNDLGKLAIPGTVTINNLATIQHYSHVMHLSSLISAEIAAGTTAIEVLKSAFPAGTLSGAPKIRAMEIIDELELSRRGVYGGAICLLDAHDNLSSCIAIRMVELYQGQATLRAGAGIVADSVPENEAQETHHKIASVIAAIKLAQGGLA